MINNYKFIIKIYGVESRRDMINSTAQKLCVPEDNIFLDDRPNGGGSLYTAKKAYLSDHGDATHVVFLQDDVEVCDNFRDICEQIIQTHPEKIISLFPFDYQDNSDELNNLSTPYVNVYTLSACGVIMPVEYIKPCFDCIKEAFKDQIADDSGIQNWAMSKNICMITTIPSLIQHIGDKSIICSDAKIRRTVYYRKNPVADWSNKDIYIAKKQRLVFYPKCKNIIRLGGILNDNK